MRRLASVVVTSLLVGLRSHAARASECAGGEPVDGEDACSAPSDDLDGFDFSLGFFVRRPSTRGSTDATSPSGAQWSVPASVFAPVTEALIDFQMRWYAASPLYFGLGFAGGWARAAGASGTYDDQGVQTAYSTEGHGSAALAYGIVGANVFESTAAEVRTELAFGLDDWALNLQTPQGCTDEDGASLDCAFRHFGFFAEPRLAADLWLGREAMIGAWAGYDLWPLGGVSVGATFTVALGSHRHPLE